MTRNSERVVLLLEKPGGETVAVVCNSRSAADRIREVTRFEPVGMARVLALPQAVAGEDE